MSRSPEDKRRTRIALIVCSSALLLRGCSGHLAKEEKSGVVVEPPKIEEITFEDIYTPSTIEIPTIDVNIEPEVHYCYPETTPTTTENEDNFEETTTTTRAK